MERKGWPWRKKASGKLKRTSFDFHPGFRSTAVSITSYEEPPSRVYVEQETPRLPIENARLLEAISLREQAEEKVKLLTEKLNATSVDMSAKEDLVKQHAKVAEEAISGWEKAEAEAVSAKEELEASVQQRTIIQDRVVHLDGALKECMRQVRQARDEHEQNIQEVILRKTNEWNEIKAALEAKQAELGRNLMESEAQNSAMAKSLQERARTIIEMTEAKAKAETEVKVLQVKLYSLEKEISALKYELHMLNKELDIRNEEREYSRKSADAAHKQHLENVKKIAKLESECQRLRTLLRKRLPGPSALAQMRMEVEGLGKDVVAESKARRSLGRGTPRRASLNSPQQEIRDAGKQIEMLTERMLSMEEETKLLKEALAKRNGEVQAARQLCAKTVNKLSVAEDQLESLQGTPRCSRNGVLDLQTEPSVVSRSEDGDAHTDDEEASCAESWASALISELAHLRKDKASHASRQSMDSCNFDPIAETIENEQQNAAASSPIQQQVDKDANQGGTVTQNEHPRTSRILASKEAELQAANLMCKDVSGKLCAVEEKLRAFQSDESAADQLHESLSVIADAREKASKLDKVLDDLRIAVASTNDRDEQDDGADHAGGDGELGNSATPKSDQEEEEEEAEKTAEQSLNGSADLAQAQSAKLMEEQAEPTKSELAESQQLVAALQARIAELQNADKAKVAEEEAAEARLRQAEADAAKLESRVASLSAEVEDQRKQYEEAVARYKAMEQKLLEAPKQDEEARLTKEREVATAKEKLAECQRTILVLGKQLTALSSPPPPAAGHSPTPSLDSLDHRLPSPAEEAKPTWRRPPQLSYYSLNSAAAAGPAFSRRSAPQPCYYDPSRLASPPLSDATSPPSSPTHSLQLGAPRSSGNAVRASLAAALNNSTPPHSTKPGPKPGSSSSFSRFFTRSSKNRR